MDLSGHISDLITIGTEMRNNPNVNKKALNKTLARLEEAELWSKQIVTGQVQGVPANRQPVQASGECICPAPGVLDRSCTAANHK